MNDLRKAAEMALEAFEDKPANHGLCQRKEKPISTTRLQVRRSTIYVLV
jgi:RNA polymerase-binding transcription factor DksA